jgi:magnesium transporter
MVVGDGLAVLCVLCPTGGPPAIREIPRHLSVSRPRSAKYHSRVPNLVFPRPPRPGVRRSSGPADPIAPEPAAEPDIIEGAGLRWIHIESPRSADRDWLEEQFQFHALDYEDVYSRNQRPKLDQYDDYVFIVLHFPLFDKDSGRILTAELDLFLGPDYLITLPNIPLPPLSAMFERYREKEDLREATFSKGSGYLLYKIVDTGVDASFPMLRKMGLKLERLEDDIFEGRSSEIVRDLSEAKQEIINFRKIVRPQRAVLRDLERTKQRYLQEELEIYFDDISDAAERIWDTLENYKEVIEGLESTNESVLSHRLNDSFRILTAASVVVLPLTLIASIFGMNVAVPGEGQLEAFWLIMILMIAMLVAMVAYFRRRGWL